MGAPEGMDQKRYDKESAEASRRGDAWCGYLCKIKANKGCTVRKTHELDSEKLGELPFNANIRVWESGFTLNEAGEPQVGRCRITHPHDGWISAKTLELIPQGLKNGMHVPRANDLDAQFTQRTPEAPKGPAGPAKTFVPASIKVVVLQLPEAEKNGPTKFNAGYAHAQTALITEREARSNNKVIENVCEKGEPPQWQARLSFSGFGSRALPPNALSKK
jgi:hypothetical protein